MRWWIRGEVWWRSRFEGVEPDATFELKVKVLGGNLNGIKGHSVDVKE